MSMGAPPSTSVIMPVRNGALYVAEAIESVLAEIGDRDEVIAIDDASTDETRRILESYGGRVVILEGSGEGPSAARNIGLKRARADLIAFLDHDDLWPRGRQAALIDALQRAPAASAAVGRVRVRVEPGADGKGYLQLDGQQTPQLIWTCLYRRALIERARPFDETLRFGEDIAYYLGLVDAGMKLVRCEADAAIYRRHRGNSTLEAPAPRPTLLRVVARRRALLRGTDPDPGDT